MKISIQSLLDGARNASGAVAMIDPFRAFPTAAVALANGASRIIMEAAGFRLLDDVVGPSQLLYRLGAQETVCIGDDADPHRTPAVIV